MFMCFEEVYLKKIFLTFNWVMHCITDTKFKTSFASGPRFDIGCVVTQHSTKIVYHRKLNVDSLVQLAANKSPYDTLLAQTIFIQVNLFLIKRRSCFL